MKLDDLLVHVRRLHEQVRHSVVSAFESVQLDELASVSDDDSTGDTIYAVDRVSEETLLSYFEEHVAIQVPIVLIAEGIEGGKVVLPRGTNEQDAIWRIIVDPIDGTRGLMYQKRSGWILTGIAPNLGEDTNLSDIVAAVQTEIPLIKQHLSDVLWAEKGKGTSAVRFNRLDQSIEHLQLRPSTSRSIRHGFAQISRFFPGVRDILAAIDDEVVIRAEGDVGPGKAHCFEDQYLSSGGQLYELMAGHDRFIADIRPLLSGILTERGLQSGLFCHPYDMCTELIARELGVLVTDEHGGPLRTKLDVDADVSWCGYANQSIKEQIEPLLRQALQNRGLLN